MPFIGVSPAFNPKTSLLVNARTCYPSRMPFIGVSPGFKRPTYLTIKQRQRSSSIWARPFLRATYSAAPNSLILCLLARSYSRRSQMQPLTKSTPTVKFALLENTNPHCHLLDLFAGKTTQTQCPIHCTCVDRVIDACHVWWCRVARTGYCQKVRVAGHR